MKETVGSRDAPRNSPRLQFDSHDRKATEMKNVISGAIIPFPRYFSSTVVSSLAIRRSTHRSVRSITTSWLSRRLMLQNQQLEQITMGKAIPIMVCLRTEKRARHLVLRRTNSNGLLVSKFEAPSDTNNHALRHRSNSEWTTYEGSIIFQ